MRRRSVYCRMTLPCFPFAKAGNQFYRSNMLARTSRQRVRAVWRSRQKCKLHSLDLTSDTDFVVNIAPHFR